VTGQGTDTAAAQRARNLERFRNRTNANGTVGTDTAAQQQAMTLEDFQNRFDTDFNASVNTTLTDPAMLNRFNQLNLQFRGLNAFSDPRIQRQLNLTSDQRQQLRRLAGEFRRDLMDLRRDARANPNVVQQQFQDLRTQYAIQTNQILNPAQQQMWQELVGQQFQFPATVFLPRTTTGATGATAVQPNTGTTTVPQTGSVPTQQDSTVR
jgi:hypothetical protein